MWLKRMCLLQFLQLLVQANCAVNTLHIDNGRWAVVDWGSTGHLDGVGCLASAAGQRKFIMLIGLCDRHLQQHARLVLQVGPRPEVDTAVTASPLNLWTSY